MAQFRIIGALLACGLTLSSCDNKSSSAPIDYKALASAIAEELAKIKQPAGDDFSKPVTLEDIDYIVDDRYYLFKAPYGANLSAGYNLPICYGASRRGGLVLFANPHSEVQCLNAIARWMQKNKLKLNIESRVNDLSIFRKMGFGLDGEGFPIPKD